MRKISFLLLTIISLNIFGQNIDDDTSSFDIIEDSYNEKNKILNGYDGGMMLHAGYVKADVIPLNYNAVGVTKGIGGAIRFHLGKHYRIGTEGYVSTLKLMDNGSYMKTFWAGLLNDFYWRRGKFMPYFGITIGGGALTDCLIFEGDNHDWEKEDYVVINKAPFFAVDPFVGCDYCISEAIHVTIKIDNLIGIGGNNLHMPAGPRTYIGFIFFH